MTPQVHVMLDLETLGTGNDAPILSIGAVKFTADRILDKFHVGIDLKSSMGFGAKPDPDTIMWWLAPERVAAREALLRLQKVDLPDALMGFRDWYRDVPTENGDVPLPGTEVHAFGADLPIWGNGSTFDNIILRSAFRMTGIDYPAPFWLDQCYRTVKNAVPHIMIERMGTHHDACDDALSQAKHLQAIWREQAQRTQLLKEAAEQFRFYEDQHRNKQTPEGDEKARVNAAIAGRIEDVLAV